MEAERNLKSAAAPTNRSASGFLQNKKTGDSISATVPIRNAKLKDWLIACGVGLLSSLLYVFAFPPFAIAEGASVFAVPILVWLFHRRPRKMLFAIIGGWGFFSWLALIAWLRHVTFGGYLFLTLLLAAYFSLWFFAAAWLLPRLREASTISRIIGMISLAALWVVHEYVRTFFLTGFPWLPLAASQWQRPLLLQTASWTGSYGVSFVLIFFNLGLAFYIEKVIRQARKSWQRISPELVVALFLFLFSGFGGFYLARTSAGERETLFNAAFIQPYIPQEIKWDPGKSTEVLQTIRRTTLSIKNHPKTPDLVVWPEAVTPFAVIGDRGMQRWTEMIAEEMEAPLFIGSVGVEKTEKNDWFNGAMVIDPERGLSSEHYRKRKLVPFGEYIPFGPLFSWISKFVPIDGSFAIGNSAAPLTATIAGKDYQLGGLICYEDVFPALARKTAGEGAEMLVVITNNAWYGEEGMPHQHAAHSVLRAVETRLPVLRSGNGGWSGWIDEYGSVQGVMLDGDGSVFFRGAEVMEISRDRAWKGKLSFYVRHGDWFVWLCVALSVFGFSATSRVPQSRKKTSEVGPNR